MPNPSELPSQIERRNLRTNLRNWRKTARKLTGVPYSQFAFADGSSNSPLDLRAYLRTTLFRSKCKVTWPKARRQVFTGWASITLPQPKASLQSGGEIKDINGRTGSGFGEPASIAYCCAMPALQNARHEGFARAVARGEPASRAYSSIYHVTGNNAEAAGSRLLRNVKVANRIAELKGAAAKKTVKTVESLVADLDEAIELARRTNNPSGMTAAILGQAKLLGLMAPQQLEILHKPAPLPTRILEMSELEWREQFSFPVTGSRRPALIDTTRRLKTEKQMLNGHARAEPVSVAFDTDNETAAQTAGVIDLD